MWDIRYKEKNYFGNLKTSHAFYTGQQKHFALAFCARSAGSYIKRPVWVKFDRTPTVDTTIYNECMNEICVVNIPYLWNNN